jgi:hypothetical protein
MLAIPGTSLKGKLITRQKVLDMESKPKFLWKVRQHNALIVSFFLYSEHFSSPFACVFHFILITSLTILIVRFP